MRNRLFKIGLLTSPIIAAYGVAPVFLVQTTIETIHLAIAFISLTVLIGFFWWINIFLINRDLKPVIRYATSYLTTFLLHSLIFFIIPNFPDQPNPTDFIFYSVASTFALSTIILVIIHSEKLKQKKDLAESEVQNLKVVNLEAQKQVLLQELQPHFLFNALSTLKSLINEDSRKAEGIVTFSLF